MPGISQIVQDFNDFSSEVIRESWYGPLKNVAFQIERSYFASKVRRSNEGVRGLVVKLPFKTGQGIGWRGLNAHGGITPSGSISSVASMSFELGFHSAAANVTLEEITAFKTAEEKAEGWPDLLNGKMRELYEALPYYMRAMLWTGSAANKALGVQNGAASGNVVTLDNDGLAHSANAADRVKLFEFGMWVQPYSSADAKLGVPVRITDIDKRNGTITLSDASACADNAYFVCSDIAGQDVPYTDKFPGILDVIDDDNTFQGVDRSAAGNGWAQAIVTDGSASTLNFDTLSQFFYDCYNPTEAMCHGDLMRAYYSSQLAENTRYMNREYKDGFESITIDGTRLVAADDVDRDKIIVPDMKNMWVAELGISNLFDQGWYPLNKQTMLEYVLVYIGRLVAKDCRKMAQLHSLSY